MSFLRKSLNSKDKIAVMISELKHRVFSKEIIDFESSHRLPEEVVIYQVY